MRLKSGTLYWPTTTRPTRAPTHPRGRLTCDALIIGAGISGAMAAHHLAAAGLSVIVVDRRPLVSGSTSASTALVLYEIDTPLIQLARKLTPRHAAAAYRATHGALHDFHTLVRSLRTSCDCIQRPSLYLARTSRDLSLLKREAAARRRLGIAAAYLDRAALESQFHISRPGAILSELAFEVNPVKLTAALLRSARRRGARVFQNAEIDTSTLTPARGPLTVRAGDATITADHIVIATGYEAPEQFQEVCRRTTLKRTYALATPRLARDPWPRRALVWETGNPYFYARTTTDDRILCGGEDIRCRPIPVHSPDPRIPAKSRTLLRKLHRLAPTLTPGMSESSSESRASIPRLRHPAFHWSGVFAETPDGLPYIGRQKNWPRILFALGYGGNGLTFSLLAAQITRDLITNTPNPNAHLFTFNRH